MAASFGQFLAFLINFCLLKMWRLLASLAMLNATFSVIFKHRELDIYSTYKIHGNKADERSDNILEMVPFIWQKIICSNMRDLSSQTRIFKNSCHISELLEFLSSLIKLHMPPLSYKSWRAQCLKIIETVAFNISSEASYLYILSGQKLIKNAKNGPFWRVFENLKLTVKQFYQTIDMSFE